jgi:hypothetical protein
MIDRGFTGALVLMLVVLALFALARFLGRDRTRSRRRTGQAPSMPTGADIFEALPGPGAPVSVAQKGS